MLAAVGVAAYVVIKKTSGDDDAGAGVAVAAAGLASTSSRSSNQYGGARAAGESGSREVGCLLCMWTATSECVNMDKRA